MKKIAICIMILVGLVVFSTTSPSVKTIEPVQNLPILFLNGNDQEVKFICVNPTAREGYQVTITTPDGEPIKEARLYYNVQVKNAGPFTGKELRELKHGTVIDPIFQTVVELDPTIGKDASSMVFVVAKDLKEAKANPHYFEVPWEDMVELSKKAIDSRCSL